MFNTSLYETLPSLIKCIGEHNFYNQVACSIQDLDPVSNTRIVSYSKKNRPIFLDNDPISKIDEIYCESAYLLDPIYDFLFYKKHKELVTLDSLVNDDFCDSIYYDTFYQRLGWSNETNIVVSTNDDTKICIVYTTKDNQFARKAAYEELTPYLNAIKAAILTHEKVGNTVQQSNLIELTQSNNQNMRHSRLDSYKLTKREKQIVELILEGLSSIAIAEKCFVSEGTIKNHRKNIYRKLAIKSQAELFRNFIQ